MRDRICIVLVNWNGKKDTLECLASLQKVDYKLFSVVVVDNGSTDGSVEAIREAFPRTVIFQTGENLGFAGGNNVAIKWALGKPFKWILLLNNDTIVAPDILRAFMETAGQYPDAKIFGAKMYRYGTERTLDHLGGRWVEERAEFESIGMLEVDNGRFEESQSVDYVCGAALLMHREVPETIGLLEPRFFLFWEETDFCYRARRKGFDVRTAPQAKVWHKVSASFVGGKPHTNYFWWRSRLLWLERNLAPEGRARIMRERVRPDLIKAARHFLLLTLRRLVQKQTPERRQKAKRLLAGLVGACHYYLGRFGNCPKWISRP
jgi:GT2 family glycosyltransferase